MSLLTQGWRACRGPWLLLAVLAAACATPAPKQPSGVFFPPPPELPRIQFLTSFSGLKDVEEQSRFNKFVVGEQQDVKLDKPYGAAIHGGKIYVCDTNATVVVFDLEAKTFGILEGALGPGRLVQPVNIAVDGEGRKYVADPGRGQVVVYDRNDAYERAYGAAGSWRPVDAVPFEGRLYVADSTNAKVWVVDLQSGEVVKTIGAEGEPTERLDRPTNLAFDADGDLFVSDIGRFQIVRFDRDGHFKGTIGKAGDNLGHFARPKGIAFDRQGRLYAVDASFANVQVFTHDGRLLLFFGSGGRQAGNFLLPAKVVIDYDNVKYFQPYASPGFQVDYLILVTSQFGERLVNVLAYGQQKGQKYPSDAELLRQIEARRQKELEQPAPPPTPPEPPPEKPPASPPGR